MEIVRPDSRRQSSIASKLDVTGSLTLVVVVDFQPDGERSFGPLHQKSCKQTALSTTAARNVITKQQRDLRVDLEIVGGRNGTALQGAKCVIPQGSSG